MLLRFRGSQPLAAELTDAVSVTLEQAPVTDGAIQLRVPERTLESRAYGLSSAEIKSAIGDGKLLSAVRTGDEGAMAVLYDRYSSIVYAVALRILSDTAAAEDVLQEVFMQLWRNPGRFDANRGALAPWLAVIARNRAIDMLRKRH